MPLRPVTVTTLSDLPPIARAVLTERLARWLDLEHVEEAIAGGATDEDLAYAACLEVDLSGYGVVLDEAHEIEIVAKLIAKVLIDFPFD